MKQLKAIEVNQNSVKQLQSEIDIYKEAIKELEQLDNDLKDLFSCIELTEDESYEKRFTSLETYLIRLSKFIK